MTTTIVQNTFLPTSIPGCVCWLDAADITTLFQNTAGTTPVTGLGQQVQFIRDKSGSGNNFSTIDTVITYNTGMLGTSTSLPSLYNTVSMSNAWTGSVTIPASATYFHVKCLTQGNAVYFYHQGTSRLKQTWNYTTTSTPFTSQWDYNGIVGITGNTNRLNVTDVITRQDTASPCTLSGWETGNSRGTVSYSLATIPVQTYSAITLWNGTTGWHGELIIFNTALGASDRQRVEGYLAWKWGVQAQLPSSSPYKNSPAVFVTQPITLSVLNITNRINSGIFLPTTIPGLQFWIDGADTRSMTFASANTISAWNDKSGNGYNLSQATSSLQPTYSSNYVNFGTASNYYMNMPQAAINNASSWSMFFVFNPINSTNWIMAKQFDGNNTLNLLSMTYSGYRSSGTTGVLYFKAQNAGTLFTGPAALTTNSVQLISMRYDGTNMQYYLNGNLASTTAGSFTIINETGASSCALGAFIVAGALENSGTTNFKLGELQFFNNAITTTQRQQVEGYLAWKWGIQANLPLSHPYKNTSAIFVTQPTTLAALGVNPYNSMFISSYFNPRSISGCQLWLDAADSTTVGMSGTRVISWSDRSVNGYTVTQSPLTSGSITKSTQNNLSVIAMNLQVMTISSFSWTAFATMFFVVNTPSWFYCAGSSGYNGYVASFNDALYNVLNNGATFRDSVLPSGTQVIPTNQWCILSIGYGGGSQATNYGVNGTLRSTTTVSPIGDGTAVAPLWLNGRWDSTSGDNVIIAELLHYNRSLSTAQRQQIEGYLAWKWGIQANLPATHPFKNFPTPP